MKLYIPHNLKKFRYISIVSIEFRKSFIQVLNLFFFLMILNHAKGQSIPFDLTIGNITAPISNACTDSFQALSATVYNYGSSIISTTSDLITVTFKVTGPIGTITYSKTIGGIPGSPILQSFGNGSPLVFTVSPVNMFRGGIYTINAIVNCPTLSNGTLSNDSLASAIVVTNQRPVADFDYNLCENNPIPFGQGLSVSGCSASILDSVIITFSISPCIDNLGATAIGQSTGPPNNCSDQYACSFATGVMPNLPPGSSFYSNAILSVSNLSTNSTSWASEARFDIFNGSPVGAGLIVPGQQGSSINSGSSNFNYITSISPSLISNLFSIISAGSFIKLGYWETWNDILTSDINVNAGGNSSIATLKIYYSYPSSNYLWFDVPNGGSSLYNLSPFDPLTHPNTIVNNSQTPGTYTFYAACSANQSCRTPVNLIINPNPVSFIASATQCEYAAGSAISIFNLSNLNSAVSGNAGSTSVNYYTDPSYQNLISNGNSFMSGSGTIYSRVNNTATGCFSSSSVSLTAIPKPQFTFPIYSAFACHPATIDIDDVISIYNSYWPSDTLFFSNMYSINSFVYYTNPYLNPHSIGITDTVYMIVRVQGDAYCADTGIAFIDIIQPPNKIVNQSPSNSSICGAIPCDTVVLNEGNIDTIKSRFNCRRIAAVKDSIDGINLGMTSVCGKVSCPLFSWPTINGQLFVNRQYSFTSANKGKAEACLYFLQQDFIDYNNSALSHVPSYPSINPFSNLCITEVFNGTIDSPASIKHLIPNSSLRVSYDSSSTVWAVCFPVDSLGNYYAHSVNPLNVVLNLTCFIQGYWNGTNGMLPVLANQSVTSAALACDSIDVELHTSTWPFAKVASTKTLLYQNGTALCNLQIEGSIGGNYYIVIKHRNGITTWSKLPVAINSSPLNYNFTTNASKAFGNNQIEVSSGVWAIYSGDLNYDENIDLLDISDLELGINTFQFGYFATDLNGDGNVDLLDSPILENNVNNFIFSNHP